MRASRTAIEHGPKGRTAKAILPLLFLLLLPSFVGAAAWTGVPVTINSNIQVNAFSISNMNPCPGDSVTITYCVAGTNQYYLPNSSAAVTLKDSALSTTDFVEPSQVGQWMLYAKSGVLNPPMTVWDYNQFQGGRDMGALNWITCTVKTITVTIPTNVNWGSNYNLILAIGEGANNVGHPWGAQEVHQTITICTPSSSQRSLIKAAEGTAAAGEKMIYWLDYTISNDTNVVVTDNLNSNLVFLDAAPGYSGVVPGQNCACTISWNLGNADAGSSPPYVKKGRLWIYVQVKVGTPAGTAINNTASLDGNSTTPLNSNPVNLVTGSGINVSVSKEQLDDSGTIPVTSLNNGQQLTYRLHFTLSGLGLKCFSDFDELAAGTNYNGTGPPGWTPIGEDGNPATLANWQVQNRPGSAVDRMIKATTTNYALLQDDCTASHNAQGNFCEGTIITEAYMGTTATDLGIALRENGQSGANWRGVWLLMSKDTSFGTGCTGNLAIQFNTGAGRTVVGCYNAPLPPDSGQWYTIKAFIQKEGCNYRYRAKYWVQGTPEPAGWFVDYLDTTNNCNTDFECAGGAGMNAGWAWRPGFGNQGDTNAFDNWRVLANNYLDNAVLYDTVPLGVDYVSANPVAQGVPANNNAANDMVRWDFTGNLNGAQAGRTYDASGYMEWKAVVDCTEGAASANNRASVNATNPGGPWNSNTTTLGIVCGTPTYTVTASSTRTDTPTATPTPSLTATRTITPSYTSTATRSITPSPTPSYTITATSTFTATRSATPTFTPSYTITATSTFTATRSATPSATQTNTLGSTPTFTATRTASPTPTPSDTVTLSSTPTATRSSTPTVTDSQTPGPSPTYTATRTASPSHTPSSTVTATRSATPTPTLTFTDSPTQSPGPSPTDTATRTVTSSFTPTYTVTSTRSATPSPTLTYTDSPTQSPGPSPTFTSTVTCTPTFTASSSATSTRSATPTMSDTATMTPTYTLTLTYTDTPANTATSTPTWTLTATPTSTYTVTLTATPSSTRSVTWTDSPTRTPSGTPTSSRTATPTVTVSFSFTVSPTITPTPIPMPHQVVLAAYNAAGELVKIIYQGGAQFIPGDLQLSADTFIGGSGALAITFPGVFATGSDSVTWGGYNDSGMLVQGGVYTIKAEITDQFNNVVALIKTVQVLPGGIQQSLRIYNSAGEMVRSIALSAPVDGAARLQTTGDAFALEIGPAGGGAAQPYKIDVYGNSGWTSASWDGLNDRGAPVSSGTYTVQLVSNQGGQTVVVAAHSVTVIKVAEPSAVIDSAILGPNPVPAGQTAMLYYDPSGLAGRHARTLVYNLAGELIGWGYDPSMSGRIDLGLGQVRAGGIYLVRFSLLSGQDVVQSRTLKLAVVQ